MSTRKDRKTLIVQEVKVDKQKAKERKAQLVELVPEEQKIKKEQDKENRKIALQKRKAEIREMPKRQRKEAIKHDKIYKKIKNRPRRGVCWSIFAVIIVAIVIVAVPVVQDLNRLFSISIDSNNPDVPAAIHNAEMVARQISDEGIVLLENNDSLPLKEKKINVFGISSFNIRYGGGGSGGADQSRAVSLYQGLENAGIEYNVSLHDLQYGHENNNEKEASTGLFQVIKSRITKPKGEPIPSYLTDDVLDQAKEYSENAMIVLTSQGVEASDFTPEQLRISNNQRELIKKVTDNFENVIIVINAGNTMELGFVEEYTNIKSVLWIGTPGPFGCDSLADILVGNTNPSGHLPDTYAYDISSNPASINFGDYSFSNIKGMNFINYNEGIYVGYRYYETVYKGNEDGYKKAIQYPFGHGLSFTEFDWEVTGNTFTDDKMQIEVKVTNKGNVEGKDVVQVYFSAPYTENGIEKSAIELAGFAKTKLLAPDAAETVAIEFDTRDMSSYDMHQSEAFLLEQGKYQIHVATNVHDIVKTLDYEVKESIVYKNDDVTDTEIKNRFEYVDRGLTYLSRSDWQGTWPNNSNLDYAASEDIVALFNEKLQIVVDSEVEIPSGVDNDLKLSDMKGASYDDPRWSDFIDQFTIEEMKELFIYGAYRTMPIERLGVPGTVLLDGPAGINSFFSPVKAASYPTLALIAATWDQELAIKMGEAVGQEANAYGVTGWYAPAMNLHRTPQGGRNFEYFSEDPLLSGKMSASIVNGAQSKDILVFMKHFVANDQETNARNGLSVWMNEQALRELYLRPFEITVKEGEVNGAMSSFVLLGHKWSGGNPELLEDVLRDEWGFKGIVSTDAVHGSFMDANLSVRYGSDLMLDPLPFRNMRYINKLLKEDPVGVNIGLRERTHNICYTLLNETNLVK